MHYFSGKGCSESLESMHYCIGILTQGSYRWPRNKSEVRNLTWREFDWLMSGIDIEQPKAIKTSCAR